MKKTKKGAASLYVVVFATILFGVITVSFARIILSEASQSSNDDLSRSAYDAALAGVEDAKIMVNQYYDCLSNNGSNCEERYNIFSDPNSTPDCKNGFPLAQKMHHVTDGEVRLQESNTGNAETSMDQAYTCVLVTDVTPDYRGTLTKDVRTKVIPINIAGTNSGSQLSNVASIQFSWYSAVDEGTKADSARQFKQSSGGSLPMANNKTVPPTVSLRLIKTAGSSIDLNAFRRENNYNNSGSLDGNIDSSFTLLPSSDAENGEQPLGISDVVTAGNAANGDISSPKAPYAINCTSTTEFACRAKLDVSGLSINNDTNVFLVAALPYGDDYTDFAVQLLDSSGQVIKLRGSQISVDSTGRTNQLVRRVETRLDPADMLFPYPQYALELAGGDGDHALNKNFWITANCWYSTPGGSPLAGSCDNNGSMGE